MRQEPRVLVSWNTSRQYIPPIRVATRQTTVGPLKNSAEDPGQEVNGWIYDCATPRGPYELYDYVVRAGIDPVFDLVIVQSGPGGGNRPENLSRFDCPRVLCLADTHHLGQPISSLIDYAHAQSFTHVISLNNRHHLHWFDEAGFHRLAWFPGISVRHLPRPTNKSRDQRVVSIGQSGSFHPRRTRIFELLSQADEIATDFREASRVESADAYANSVLSLNVSLNGDLNMRVFEVLSAGGCLLTDALSEEAGLDLLFEDGREILTYADERELIDRARYYLEHPDEAYAIARAGHRRYVENYCRCRSSDCSTG